MSLMEAKKGQKVADTNFSFGQVQNFVGEVKAEIHRINWTDKEELRAYTKIVVIATFIFGFSIYVADLLIRAMLGGLSSFVHMIFG